VRSARLLGCVLVGLVAVALLPLGCSTRPPDDVEDGCEIFSDKNSWYRVANDSYKKWGVPVHVQLAIIHQESRFVDDARPARKKIFGMIPWKRPSSAYGYAQVIDGTWEWYISDTGNRGADRDDFDDAVDFIGWYGTQTQRRLGISKTDAYNQYLAFHEGHGGYARGSHKTKAWLLRAAKGVERRSTRYRAQLQGCAEDLPKSRGFWFF